MSLPQILDIGHNLNVEYLSSEKNIKNVCMKYVHQLNLISC